jgi:hypothetical protein
MARFMAESEIRQGVCAAFGLLNNVVDVAPLLRYQQPTKLADALVAGDDG